MWLVGNAVLVVCRRASAPSNWHIDNTLQSLVWSDVALDGKSIMSDCSRTRELAGIGTKNPI